MSDYLEKYTKKISQSGNSISESINTNTMNYIQSKFKDSTTYRRAKYYHRKNDIRFDGEIDIRVLDIRRMGSIKNVLLRPSETLDVGNTLVFDDEEWLIYDRYGSKENHFKLEISKINDRLIWVDANGIINDLPCVSGTTYIGSKSRQNRYDIETNTYDVRLPAGQIFVFAEYNKDTKTLDLNQRFIFGRKVYEIAGIDDVTSVESSGYGIVQFTMKLTTIKESDDFETGIAENHYKNEESENGGGGLWG